MRAQDVRYVIKHREMPELVQSQCETGGDVMSEKWLIEEATRCCLPLDLFCCYAHYGAPGQGGVVTPPLMGEQQ